MAVQYNLPPWIKGAQTAQMYAHGFPLGLEAGQAAARIHQLQAQMQLEAQKAAISAQHQQLAITLAQQREQRESIQKQQELEVQKSYHEEQSRLKQEQISQAEEKLQQAAAITGRKLQVQQMVKNDAIQMMQEHPDWPPQKAWMMANIQHAAELGIPLGGIGALGADISKVSQPAFVPGPVKGQPVLDSSGTAIPGMIAVPGMNGQGMSVRDVPKVMGEGSLANPQSIAILKKTLGYNATPEQKKTLQDLSNAWMERQKKAAGITPKTEGEIPDWATLPGEDQAPASLSDIASRIKAGPAVAEADVPDYAKLPGEDLTGPIPLPNTEKELSADETYLNPKGPGLLQWNPDTKKLSVIEQPQQEEPPPETEADAPLPGEE